MRSGLKWNKVEFCTKLNPANDKFVCWTPKGVIRGQPQTDTFDVKLKLRLTQGFGGTGKMPFISGEQKNTC